MILAIDPGPTESGWVRYDPNARKVVASGVLGNADALGLLHTDDRLIAIEWVESFGMAVGRSVFDTVWWTGRFEQFWCRDAPVRHVTRRECKLHLCNSARAKDANIRQALIDKLGAPGTKAKPGGTYGVKSHAWAALAVAVTAAETEAR